MSCTLVFLLVALAAVLRSVPSQALSASGLQIQLQEQLIVQHNDSVYVQRVMRLAKSAEMRNYMQPDTDACENFYEYSCGNWAKINPAEAVRPRETNYYQLLDNAYRHKRLRLLEQAADPESDDAAVLKLKRFYASCLHFRETPRTLYRQQLQALVGEFGRMPVFLLPGQEWPASEFNWLETVARIKNKYGFDILLRLDVAPDLHNNTRNRVYIGQPWKLGLESKSMYSSAVAELYRQEYVRHISEELVQHLHVEAELATVTAREILNLEIALSKGMVDPLTTKPLSGLTQSRTAADLAAAYAPTFNLTQYIELALGHVPNDTLYEYVPDYQKNLLGVVSSTPPRVLANYIFQQLLQKLYYDLDAPAVDQCLSIVGQQFPEILDHMLYLRLGDAATLTDIQDLWKDIKASFRESLQNTSSVWITATTRELALEKLNATHLQINGYADVNFTDRYAQLHIAPHDYLTNLRAVLEHETRQRLKSLSEKPASLPAPTKRSSLAPVYLATENAVRLPVALLQPNFLWSRYYPRALKYGTLGYLLARELVHGFDELAGSQADWWDAKSTAEYGKRKKCFKQQYGRFRQDGHYLAESDLQAENIADNAAVQLAYKAYSDYLKHLSSSAIGSEALPRLQQTPQQLFFLSFAQFWCTDADDRFKEKVSLLNIHTPNAFRVIGPLSNFQAFARDHRCAAETTMNPSQKCQLYGITSK
ncbi:neprilysin-4 [Scaptodrosophila lebanonensis]|uniref:Neprilysin-4 n=1 Tax=Drosophila lebanonensis TaxID=7225 RepID=A0A6J2T3U4_DROLE|nr:neprilysin-4 [Scaptodrosophila lebanonensis]